MKMNFGFIILTICLLTLETQGIYWNGNWAMNCDFPGNDVTSVKSPGELCSTKCQQHRKCTHYAWTRYNGGTCWLKSGEICKDKAVWNNEEGSVCGVVIEKCSGSQITKGALIWSDEFQYSGAPSTSVWREEVGGHGWGNNEKQYYTSGGRNAQAGNGNLVITSKLESFSGSQYTSARLISNKSFKYGIFEMRAKLPKGRGIWSAFWLLAAKRPLDWPRDGELDVMENVGYDPNVVHATIHTAKFNHMIGTQIGKQYRVTDPHNQFHVYTMDWTPTYIKCFIDGNHFFTYNKPDNSFEAWPFDTEFNVILNVAVGGNWGGAKGIDNGIFPTTYTIDYVRQYNNGFVMV